MIWFSFPLNSYLQDIRKIHTYESGLISINFDQLIHFQADLPLIKVSFSVHEWNGFSAARSPEHKYPQMQKLKSVFKMFQFFKYLYYQHPQLKKRKKLQTFVTSLTFWWECASFSWYKCAWTFFFPFLFAFEDLFSTFILSSKGVGFHIQTHFFLHFNQYFCWFYHLHHFW